MVLVLLLNLVQADEDDNLIMWDFLWQITCVFIAEVMADWIKHAFITKFNNHNYQLYLRFKLVLVQVCEPSLLLSHCIPIDGLVRPHLKHDGNEHAGCDGNAPRYHETNTGPHSLLSSAYWTGSTSTSLHCGTFSARCVDTILGAAPCFSRWTGSDSCWRLWMFVAP